MGQPVGLAPFRPQPAFTSTCVVFITTRHFSWQGGKALWNSMWTHWLLKPTIETNVNGNPAFSEELSSAGRLTSSASEQPLYLTTFQWIIILCLVLFGLVERRGSQNVKQKGGNVRSWNHREVWGDVRRAEGEGRRLQRGSEKTHQFPPCPSSTDSSRRGPTWCEHTCVFVTFHSNKSLQQKWSRCVVWKLEPPFLWIAFFSNPGFKRG